MASRSSQRDRRAGKGQAAAGRPSKAAAAPTGAGRRPSSRGPRAGGRPERREKQPGLELIYGRNAVGEALRGRRRVHTLLVAGHEAGRALDRVVPGWEEEASRYAPPVYRMTSVDLTAHLGSDEHQGIAAEVDPYPYVEAPDVLRDRTLLVALDGVQDPHNLGAIIRTAEGAGAGVVVPRHRATAVTAAVVKASAGATEHAAVAQVRNLADFLGQAKGAGFWLYSAAAGAGSSYATQDYRHPTCFVLGSEGTGLGRRVAALCDVAVGLPLAGRIGSLNVSVAAGILLYEALRQRG